MQYDSELRYCATTGSSDDRQQDIKAALLGEVGVCRLQDFFHDVCTRWEQLVVLEKCWLHSKTSSSLRSSLKCWECGIYVGVCSIVPLLLYDAVCCW